MKAAILAGMVCGAMACAGLTGAAQAADPLKPLAASIEGGTLHYEEMGGGDGPPLVLVNGGPGFDHRYFHGARPWEGLAKRRKLVFYDQRGTGRSTSTLRIDRFTVDLMVADRTGGGAVFWGVRGSDSFAAFAQASTRSIMISSQS